MKIGVRAHDYGKMKIEELAEKLHEAGYQAAQLALPKVFTEIGSYESITPSHLERIRNAFEKYQIEIPVFGCYMDIGNPDTEVREYAVKTLKMCLAYSKEIGAKTVGTETAYLLLTKEEKRIWYPYMLDSLKRVMDEAARLDVKLAIEPVYGHPLDSLEAVLDVMGQIGDETHLRMILDPSNLLEFPDRTVQEEYWENWMEYTGKYIAAIHMKDFVLDEKGNYFPMLLGQGVVDYRTIFRWLHENAPDMYLLREDMNPATAQEDIRYMRSL